MANLKLDIRVENLDKVRKALDMLSGPQARQAYANAINDTAKHVQAEMRKHLQSAFDRPTEHIWKSPKYTPATPDNLSASIIPTIDSRNKPGKGGKVGVDQQKILQAQEFGGRRRDKKSEVVLRRAGILMPGWQTAIPETPFPGSDDGHGNLRGAFLQQLLSYMQAYSEQGYRANMTQATMKNLRRGGTAARLAKIAGPVLGRRYFVSYGKWREGRTSHFAPGIWAVLGSSGANVRPVVMFVRAGTYTPRISMDRVTKDAGVQEYLDRKIRLRIRRMAEGKDT